MPVRFLISRQQYIVSGMYIGTKQKTKDMKEFVADTRPDGLALFDIKKMDERIRVAVGFLLKGKNILLASRKKIAFEALEKFSEIIGANIVTGRFMPGTLTNPQYEKFYEAGLVFVADPMTDYRVVEEAVGAGVPVMAVCNSFNETKNIDFIIPSNNSSRRAMATLFWLLAREMMKSRGDISGDREYKYKLADFGYAESTAKVSEKVKVRREMTEEEKEGLAWKGAAEE